MNKLLSQYRNMSRQIKASLWFVVSNVLVKGISFFTLPVFSRLLTTGEYGTVSVYQSWVSVISIITTLTIWGGGFNVGMVKYPEQEAKMISSFQGLAVSLTMAAAIISLLLLPQLEPLLELSGFLILCMYLEILAQIPFNLWATEQRYNYEYKKLITATVIISILSPLAGIAAVLHTSHKPEARIISNLSVQLAAGIILFFHNQKKGRKFFEREFWKFGFSFNIVLIPHYLSMQILNQSDRIMIHNICGESDAGIYSAAYNFAMLMSLFINGINSSLTPYLYQCLQKRNTAGLQKQVTAVVLLVAVLATGLIAIIPDIFHLLLPESYYPALKVIPPVTAGMFFLFLYPLFGAVEFYFEENRYVTLASIAGALLNIILNYIFIPLYGFPAAAYTTLFCYICFSICHYMFMKIILKKRKLDMEIYDIRSLAVISCTVIAGSVLMVSVYDRPAVRWILIFLISSILVRKRMYFKSLLNIMRQKG